MKIDYPSTKRINQVDDYHGTLVEDPYRWLENDKAKEVKEWVITQNNLTQDYLSKISFRGKIARRYTELFNFTKVYNPIQVGDYILFYKNEGLQNQPVIYRQKGMEGTPEVFLNPNEWSQSGNISITANNSLKVKINGSGDVNYKGNPFVDIDINGSGDVNDAN